MPAVPRIEAGNLSFKDDKGRVVYARDHTDRIGTYGENFPFVDCLDADIEQLQQIFPREMGLKVPYIDAEKVRVKTAGNVIEVREYQKKDRHEIQIERISSNLWMNKKTGEVFEKVSETRVDSSLSQLYGTFGKIRWALNANLKPGNFLHIVLTYSPEKERRKENGIQDEKQIAEDFERFRKRFHRYLTKRGIVKPEYISIVEPQARGAWHYHVFFIWEYKAPFIEYKDIEKLWGQGFVFGRFIKESDGVDNIGAYFGAYFTDLPIDEFREKYANVTLNPDDIQEKVIDGEKKKFVKGGRVWMYPSGMQIFRHSNGIKKPVEREIPQAEKYDIIRGLKPVYVSDKVIKRESKNSESPYYNRIVSSYYNVLRPDGKRK